jgi:hypothetical protein
MAPQTADGGWLLDDREAPRYGLGVEKAFDESEHPRDEQGQWTEGGPAAGVKRLKLADDAVAAVGGTPGAKITEDGIEVDVSRYQDPGQSGELSVRTGVFFLPEHKSPWGRHYTGKPAESGGYGGTMKIEGRVTLRNPFVVRASTGGNAVVKAYDAVEGKGAYERMRTDVLQHAMPRLWGEQARGSSDDLERRVRGVLEKYGGEPGMAAAIIEHSGKGNLHAYAIQEHIAAHALRKAGYDSVLGYSKHKGQPRLAEVFDLTQTHYPDPFKKGWAEKAIDPAEWTAEEEII